MKDSLVVGGCGVIVVFIVVIFLLTDHDHSVTSYLLTYPPQS